jgi:hypothetical protein
LKETFLKLFREGKASKKRFLRKENLERNIFIFFQPYLNMKWWINGVSTLIVSAFGLSGNLVSFCVLVTTKLQF